MNVLLSPWLPVCLTDGTVRKIAPVELLTSGALRVAHPRADFCALATEMLVELFQTFAAPADLRARLAYLRQPAAVNLDAMKSAAGAFELFGPGVRFMQSATGLGSLESASSLVFETPRGNTLKKNTDLFVSRNELESVCPHCAAIGLYLNQAHARVGGVGYFTTCRGGSALSVLVRGASLWETVVLNLLPADHFSRHALLEADSAAMPWASADAVFTANEVAPSTAGSHAVLWWCPVAVHLVDEPNTEAHACGLCGEVHDTHVKSLYRAATKSRQPGGLIHPRTAWGVSEKTGKPYPLQVPQGSQRLEDWTALVLGRIRGSFAPVPAVALLRGQQTKADLWAFGYQMDNMTMERWYDETSPVLHVVDEAHAEVLRHGAAELLSRVEAKRKALFDALTANLADSAKRKAPLPLRQAPDALMASFETRSREALLVALDAVDCETRSLAATASEAFDKTLSDAAFGLFEGNTVFNPLAVGQTRRILLVRRALLRKLYPKVKSSAKQKAPALAPSANTDSLSASLATA